MQQSVGIVADVRLEVFRVPVGKPCNKLRALFLHPAVHWAMIAGFRNLGIQVLESLPHFGVDLCMMHFENNFKGKRELEARSMCFSW